MNIKLRELLARTEALAAMKVKPLENNESFIELSKEFTKNLNAYGGFGPNQECAANSVCSSNGSCVGNSNCQNNDVCTGGSNTMCPIK